MRTLKRIFSYLGILLAALLIAAFAGGIFFSWQINTTVKTAAQTFLTTGENLVSTVQKGVVRVENRVDNLYAATSGVESALNQISANVQDKGLILTLLPPEKEKELTDSVKEIIDVYTSIRDTLLGIKQLYMSFNSIPFVNLPMPSDDLIHQANQVTEKLDTSVNDLSTKIQDFRIKSAGTVDTLTGVVSEVNAGIEDLNSELNQLDQQLYATQTGLARLKSIIPAVFNLVTIIVDLFLLWMIFGNVAIIRWSLQTLSATKSVKSTPEPSTELDSEPTPEKPAETSSADETSPGQEPADSENAAQ